MTENNLKLRNKFVNRLEKRIDKMNNQISLLTKVDKKLLHNQSGGSAYLLGMEIARVASLTQRGADELATKLATLQANIDNYTAVLNNIKYTPYDYKSLDSFKVISIPLYRAATYVYNHVIKVNSKYNAIANAANIVRDTTAFNITAHGGVNNKTSVKRLFDNFLLNDDTAQVNLKTLAVDTHFADAHNVPDDDNKVLVILKILMVFIKSESFEYNNNSDTLYETFRTKFHLEIIGVVPHEIRDYIGAI
jgi:hypothetical protein